MIRRARRIAPALALVFGGCGGSGRRPSRPDAGKEAGAGDGGQDALASDTAAPEGPAPKACDPPCGGKSACLEGACVPACDAAAGNGTFIGCLFFAYDMDNYVGNDNKPLDYFIDNDIDPFLVVVANPHASEAAKVTFEHKVGGSWMPAMSATVAPGSVQLFQVPSFMTAYVRHVEGSAVGKAQAYRITSDMPLIAYQYNADDSDTLSSSSGGAVLMPVASWDREYLATTLPQTTPGAAYMLGRTEAGRGEIVVVASMDATTVTVTLPKALAGKLKPGSGVPAAGAGESFTVMLDEGDALQFETDLDGDDLTGTAVSASRAVAVFSGNTCATIDVDVKHVCDHVEEQVPPTRAWGRQFVAAHLVPQLASDRGPEYEPECPPDADRIAHWKFLAADDGTVVTFDRGPEVAGLPDTLALDRGESATIKVTGTTKQPGDFFVTSTKPVSIAQFMTCELAMVMTPPLEQYLDDYLFVAPNIFENQVTVVRKAGVTVLFDGAPMMGSLFVDAGGGFEVARVKLKACAGDPKMCAHRVTGMGGEKVGVAVRGMDANCSYAYVGGTGFRCLSKTVSCK